MLPKLPVKVSRVTASSARLAVQEHTRFDNFVEEEMQA
jgi:hypothetical protein